MNAKFTLAIIALIGIGVFALPSTMSLFAGQHSFYNIDATGNQVPCKKCHGDVQAELLANAGTNIAQSAGPHALMTCEDCHRQELGLSSGDDAYVELVYENNLTPMTARVLALTVEDYEANNFPQAIDADATTVNVMIDFVNNHGGRNWSLTDPARSRPNGNALLSPKNGTGTGDLEFAEAKYKSTVIAGIPKDATPGTMYGGLYLHKGTAGSWNMTPSVPTLTNLTGMGSKTVNPGATYHAASLVSCFECHGGSAPSQHESLATAGASGTINCNGCHYGSNRWRALAAGGFGLTAIGGDNGSAEAHNAWVETQGVSRFAYGTSEEKININNDACIACHTHVAVDINFAKNYKLLVNATAGLNTVTGESGYSVTGSGVEGKVYISVYGNQNGDTFAVSNQVIDWTSDQKMFINGQGTAVFLDLNNESSDDAAALAP